MPAQSSVGREIRRLRAAAGITLEELSRRTGVREAYLAAIEDDREEPSASALQRLVGQLEPAGTSYEAIARLLTGPEFDASGEYAPNAHAGTDPPALPGDANGAHRPQTPELDGIAAAADGVWRHKNDVQVVEAAGRLDEYTAAAQRAILNELDRRGLARSGNVSGASERWPETRCEGEELQFDHVITEAHSSAAPSKPTAICAVCRTSIETEYYDVNGTIVCDRCRAAVAFAAETPRGIGPLIIAGVFGLGAGVVGAMIYYAVLAIAHLEIGLVAVLIGYMVGYAVRKGAGGRGGRRFQILAVALTYASVALAYTPIAFRAFDADPTAQKAATTSGEGRPAEATMSRRAPTTTPTGGRFLLGVMFLSAFIAALPVLVVVGSFPSGLISAIIIFVGMRQAWIMTGAPLLQILGPYRVGAAPVSTSV